MYNADRPLVDRVHDELGLADVADAVAAKLIALQPEDGIVIGLQSPWGMGKSTFLNFLSEKLEVQPGMIIVRFAPWLVDDRNALLHELFSEMSHALEKSEARHAKRWDIEESRNRRITAQRLRQFTRLAERLKSLPYTPHLSWTKDLFNLPILREIGATFSFIISTAASIKPKDETLREVRADIASRLRLLNRKIVVIVDDVDRLDVEESREVFRLVRAVADFPNVTYIVAFDRAPLDFDTNRSPDIARSYLDKIIQIPIFLPEPEPVDLRRMLTHALIGSPEHPGILGRLPRVVSTPRQTDSEADRLAAALGRLTRTYLNSPRRIGMIQNVLMTTWPSIAEDVDVSDFLIHLCLVNFDRPLALWIDDYLAVRASRRRSVIDPVISAALRQRLDAILNSALRYREDRLFLLRSLLPSMRSY